MAEKKDQHELIQDIKALMFELGRVPKRDEFIAKHGNAGRTWIERMFGSWTLALAAAGLLTENSRKIDSSIFQVDIEKHLEQHEIPAYTKPEPHPSFAIISDIHWPFSNQNVIERFYQYCLETQPEWIIINGDAWDMFSHSRFPRSHNIFTPREEQNLARAKNEEFWAKIHQICPKAKKVQLMGNHDVRPMKQVLEKYPSAEDWVAEMLARLFTFEGVKTILDPRQELMIAKDYAIFHGYLAQLGAHRDFTLMNVCNGHTHKGGVVYKKIKEKILSEANSGYAGDPTAKGLTYTPQKIVHWTPGFLGGDKWGVRFIIG